MTITPITIPMMRPRFDASDVPSPLCQKIIYEKSLLASFVHLHEIIRRYILRMDLPLIRICCHMIRVHLFLKANLIYKIHDGIQYYTDLFTH